MVKGIEMRSGARAAALVLLVAALALVCLAVGTEQHQQYFSPQSKESVPYANMDYLYHPLPEKSAYENFQMLRASATNMETRGDDFTERAIAAIRGRKKLRRYLIGAAVLVTMLVVLSRAAQLGKRPVRPAATAMPSPYRTRSRSVKLRL
ncbi:hypothetical protein cyc_06598 [Cyclospora cayetanensis]|uniref:Transmembrane protein n=1 Tax=Cyclospora cayetanensis TaxID=88456 RepID=A0A1D3D4I8_9EIME|nr:hypothetical protein cyc_06598 [Cyclospora cayetanensis]